MFVITLEYIKPLSEIEQFLPEHMVYLERYYADGTFLLSGRQNPRVGGVIIAQAASREEMMRIVAEDPFFGAGVAEYKVIEFLPTKTAPGMERLRVTA